MVRTHDFPVLHIGDHLWANLMEFAATTPTVRVFVSGQCHSIGHNPHEYLTPEDCIAGASALVSMIIYLAQAESR